MAAQRPEELFDVVNDHDEVIDTQSRAVVHRLGLRHRAVHVLVFNAAGRVFLQKRSLLKDSAPGKWDSSASGHLDTREDYDTCAIRELQEELGLKIPHAPKRLFKMEACAETGQEFVWIYSCTSEGPFTLHPEEIEDGRWFEPVEVDGLIVQQPEMFAASFRHIWRKFSTMRRSDAASL